MRMLLHVFEISRIPLVKKTKHYKLYDLVNQKVKLEVDMYYSLRITLYKLQSWVKYQI